MREDCHADNLRSQAHLRECVEHAASAESGGGLTLQAYCFGESDYEVELRGQDLRVAALGRVCHEAD